MISSVFQKIGFLGILGPTYCGIGATIRIDREMQCLPYAGFLNPKNAFKVTLKSRSEFQIVDFLLPSEFYFCLSKGHLITMLQVHRHTRGKSNILRYVYTKY